MAAYDSRPDTWEHIHTVRGLLDEVIGDLMYRGAMHDQSKLRSPEVEVFDRVTPKLRGLTYGSDEYKASLVEMGEGLTHHYAVNDHHPEYFPPAPIHGVAVDIETAWHPNGEEYTVAVASCDRCGWTWRGDEGDARDAAAQHEHEATIPSGVHAMSPGAGHGDVVRLEGRDAASRGR